MIIMAAERQSGKTIEAIKIAYATNSVLIEPNAGAAFQAKKMSEKMKMPITTLTADQCFDRRTMHRDSKQNIVIDDLGMILNKVFGANVIMATSNGIEIDNVDIKDLREEPILPII